MKTDINSIAVSSNSPLFTREIPEPSAEDEQLFGRSNVPLLKSQTWDKAHVLSSVNESISASNPGKITGGTDQATSLTNQSGMSLLPNQTPWALEHVIPVLEPKLSLSDSQEVVHQGYQSSIDCSNTAPAAARNTVNNGTGLNFIGGSSLAPIIIPSGQNLLPWLHRIVLFPLTQPAPVPNFSTSPAVVNVPSHILWRNPQLFEGTLNNFEPMKLMTEFPTNLRPV